MNIYICEVAPRSTGEVVVVDEKGKERRDL